MGKELSIWSTWITSEWTWLYIGSQNIWIGVLLYILCSKYRHIKVGEGYCRWECGQHLLRLHRACRSRYLSHRRTTTTTRHVRHSQLGKDDEKPKYSFGTWFAMLFTCGVATGLWYYTAESMWHYKNYGNPRWANMPDNERAIHSIMVTWFHWGLHGWIPVSQRVASRDCNSQHGRLSTSKIFKTQHRPIFPSFLAS